MWIYATLLIAAGFNIVTASNVVNAILYKGFNNVNLFNNFEVIERWVKNG